ncbi:poly(A)-specific ribonuclease [Ranunculus cassubicifolius]
MEFDFLFSKKEIKFHHFGPVQNPLSPFFCASNNMTSPLQPKFKSVEKGEIITDSPDFNNGFKFSIVSYNILGQVFVKSSYFPHSPSPCLKWKARSQAVLKVLKGFESDFLCLQELDEYDSFYKEKLEASGYSSIYIQRSGQKRDGCGIFYKQDGPELVLEEKIEYNDLVPALLGEHNETTAPVVKDESLKKERGDPNDPRVRLKRDCVGIMGAFRLNDPSNHIVIVANTHIYWDPEWADVKLAQAEYLLLRLSQFKDIVSNNFDCCPSIIVCGDFNSIPGDKVYQYLVSGSSSSDDQASLCSVYAYTGGEPAFTNCTPQFTNTLDYIFFSPSGHLKPVSVLELPGPDSSDVAGGLPNFIHPSDHLPIGAEFEVIRM